MIISDMEFDQGTQGVPNYEEFERKFKALGYEMPEVVFWNVNARRVHFAAKADQPNIRLVSGASASVIDAILENRSLSAEEHMLETLSKYDYLDELLA